MKLTVIAIATVIALAGCSSARKATVESAPIEALNAQKLSSSFKRQGIKIEWDCKYFTGVFDATCIKNEIKAIEVTGYAPSFGASEVMRETAFKVAHDQALDKLIRFVKQDISSSRVTNTIAKNIEKAEDNIKRKIKRDEEFEMTDEEAMKDTNIAVRKNTSDTVRTMTDSVRTNAQGIIKGARAIEEEIVGPQTVKVVIRWDTNSERASNYLRSRFIKQ